MIDRPFNSADQTHRTVMFQSIRALPQGWYDVTFAPKKRSCEAARGYLHGCVMPLYAAYLGECNKGEPFGDDEGWEAVKRQFRPREYVNPATGEIEVVGRSTKGMTPKQLFELTTQIVEWMEDQGVNVPAPDPNWKAARERAMKKEQYAQL